MTTLEAIGAALLLLFSTCAGATSICRWVDSAGRTQIAAVVPEKYQKVAACTDSQRYELTPEQVQAAEKRTADDQARAQARRGALRPPTKAASGAGSAAQVAPQPSAKRPSEIVTEATDCSTWWRIYDESVECFGPYRTTRGATKVEAFDHCNVIASPEPKCGPRSN